MGDEMSSGIDADASVVIVNYNSGLYLERCLRSLLRSTINLEICIVDNHSSDNSLELIESLQTRLHKLQIIRNTRNLGFSSGVNIGANATSSPHLMVLNPDCYVHSHTIESLVAALRQKQDAGMAGALVFNEDGTEQAGCRRNEPTFAKSAVKALGLSKWFNGVDLRHTSLPKESVKVDAISGSAMMFHRHLFDEIGGMDEGFFLHCEDLDICRRMRDSGYGVYFVPTVSLFHRQGVSGNATNSQVEALKHQGMLRYYSKHSSGGNPLKFWATSCLVWSHFLAKKAIGRVRALRNLPRNQESAAVGESAFLDNLPGPDTQTLLLVTGANSDTGDFLLRRISQLGGQCVAPFRSKPGTLLLRGVHWLSTEYFNKAPIADLPGFRRWVNLAPIWTIEQFELLFIPGFPERIVALSSTSIEMKADSEDRYENDTVAKLGEGEQKLRKLATQNNSQWVILRPALIYGGPRNRNINLIRQIIRKLHIFPIVGDGEGYRQPIHADDVAHACELVLSANMDKKTYSIAGSEVLSFRQMVERTFDSVGLPHRFIKVSPAVAKLALRLVKRVPGFKGLSPGIVDRLQKDQVFSNHDAMEEFGFSPRQFEP